MPFYSIYHDFLKFLDVLGHKEPWEAYTQYYYNPNKAFLDCYWGTFRWMDLEQIRDRVKRIRDGDYSNLKSLIQEVPLENMARDILLKCMSVMQAPEEPEIYFMVGFFSADGFVLELGGKPVIGFGLERFKSWRLFPILFAHEYAHYLRHLWRGDEPYLQEGYDFADRSLLSEGISTAFSEVAFPTFPLREHLFLSEERLRWCQRNEEKLRVLLDQALRGEKDWAVFWKGDPDQGLPPRVGAFLGYCLVKEYYLDHPESAFQSLLGLKDIRDLADEHISR